MGDREARIVGAGTTIIVEDKTYTLSPLTFKQLQEIQREALKAYKRNYLQTFSDNLDLLPQEVIGGLLEKKLEEVAKWDISDLPKKKVYNTSDVPVTPELSAWIQENFDPATKSDRDVRMLLQTALDGEKITPTEVQKLTGRKPAVLLAPYDSWWITADYNGMVTFVWTSLHVKHPEVSRNEMLEWPFHKLAEAANLLEGLVVPELGNT